MKMPGILIFLGFICSSIISAQPTIHVTEEPFHRPVFKSDSLTVIELFMEKGDTSLFHLHREPILYLTLNGATMWLNSPEGNSREVDLPTGWIGSDNYGVNNTFTHQIAVADGGPLHLIAILRNAGSDAQFPVEEDDIVYRENGFGVKTDSLISAVSGSERINIVVKGRIFKGEKEIGPGEFFFSHEKLSKPGENFRYYRIFF